MAQGSTHRKRGGRPHVEAGGLVMPPLGRSGANAGAHRRRRWEPYFIAVVLTLLALIFGAGAIIAHGKSQASLERTFTPKTPQAVAATIDEPQTTTISKPQGLPAPSAGSERDALFAVDPGKSTWSLEPSGRKVIYLTIDDGPSENTAAVLDVLDRYGCKATFFVVGHNPEYYPMIAEAYRRGHSIGLHTYSHEYAEVYASEDAYFADLAAIGEVVRSQIGYVPCFIRFPGGSSNEVSADYCPGIMSALTERVQQLGYQYYDWNVSTGDGSEHSAEELASYGCDGPEEGDIVLLCHDSATKQTTVEALPAIIEHYQALGYSFEALDRDSWACHHDVLN